MEFIADFHIHSKYSRATSRDMDVAHIAQWAKLKGITLMGTGDFTHHLWLEELKRKLEPTGKGLFVHDGVHFILSAEVSSIYSKGGRTYRIHNVILAPSFKSVDILNRALSGIGNLSSDGRPILGLDAEELARMVFEADENCILIPAHCLLPDEIIHTSTGPRRIKDITTKEKVYTHRCRYKGVKEVLSRPYHGDIYHVKPYYFREGLKTTPEHPFYVFKHYKVSWCQAKDIEKGDCLLFPRFANSMKDKKELKISGFLKRTDYVLKEDRIYPRGNKVTGLKNLMTIDLDFCRLSGYFVSEGYTNSRDCVAFCFHRRESDYIEDVKNLMQKIFGISLSKTQTKEGRQGIELIFYSKILVMLFHKLFYNGGPQKRARAKCLPAWMLSFPLDKQAEIFKGWWRGDTGYTSSRDLMNQMKVILLRLGVIPSIRKDSVESYAARGKHKIAARQIRANYDSYHFSNLSFFEDRFGLLKDRLFRRFKTKINRRHGWMDEKYVYLPVRDIEVKEYQGDVYNLEVEKDNSYVSEFAIIHNCWTPWFSLFGSMSGFDRIEDCFGKQTSKIFALETGLSCYDEKTEVLTKAGWKKFSDVNYSDKVCTLDIKTEKIEFQVPQKIYSCKYKGKMYKIRTKRVDLLVTPNHKLLYSPCDFRNRRPYRLKEAELLFRKSKIFKKDGIWVGKNPKYFNLPSIKIKHGSRHYSGFRLEKEKRIPINPWLRFFGFWLAEGWVSEGKDGNYDVCVSNRNQDVLEEMEKILNGFGYRTFRGYDIVRVRNFQLFSYLKTFGKCYDKHIPQDIKSLSKELLAVLLDYYIKGDGHVYGRTHKGLLATTTSIRLRDDLQEVALKVGMSAYYKRGYKKGKLFISPGCGKLYRQRNDAWIIFFIRRNRPIILPSEIRKYGYLESWVKYDGRVFCVAVPNHVVYIRRNGIPLWCGNSDPSMNWRLSALDRFSLVSNSDSHSPQKIGREANVFDCGMDYMEIRDVLKTKDKKRFLYTIEFFPQEGKYHYDGHRLCQVRFSPDESRRHNNRCPRCGKPVTIGVMNRVEHLADRAQGFIPPNAIPFKNLIPLDEIIADARQMGKASMAVGKEYRGMIQRFGTELDILTKVSQEELERGAHPRIAEGIARVRAGHVKLEPGYDGEYGKVAVFAGDEPAKKSEEQIFLF